MPLLQLPPEILIRIFDFWSTYAHTACFRGFYVTPKTLRRLLSSPYVGTSLPLIKDSVGILDLELKGYEDWDLISYQAETIWNSARGHAMRDAWTLGALYNDLSHLATLTKQSRKLRLLRIHATSEVHPGFNLINRRDYLFTSTIRAFLSVSNLTSLELDLCGTSLRPWRHQEPGERFHVCTDIAALLTTLQRLRLRMRDICADVLKPLQHSTHLRLNEVLINLSLSHESSLITSATHATHCGSSPRMGFLKLKADIQKQAQVLVAQMAAPKKVRILTHAQLNIEMQAFDVLTGRNLALGECAEWDGDGKVIDEEESDEESEISSLDWDNDG